MLPPFPDSAGLPSLRERHGHTTGPGGESKFTDKFHRCLGHVRPSKAKYGYGPGTEYAICTSSIGYSGSYKRGFRQGARTPAGRQRKLKGE